MPLKLFTSNRLEILSETLAETLTTPLSSPFTKEIIVVQSSGMERWLSLRLAEHLGICANMHFPFPNTFVNEIFRTISASLPTEITESTRAFEPAVLTWRIMNLLPGYLERPHFQQLQQYFQGQDEELKLLQLSSRIADLFDQYVLFRRDMIARWESGALDGWQAELWAELIKGYEGHDRSAVAASLIYTLRKTKPGKLAVPERLSIFGIAALPELHMEIFAALSRHTDVHLFLMNPCREYWGLIQSPKEIARSTGGQLAIDFSAPNLRSETGNTLLASLGKLGRDFFDMIEDKSEIESVESFEELQRNTLLRRLQSDILSLNEPGQDGGREAVSDQDRSIQFHSCHSRRREVEILQNHLLSFFETTPDLAPSEILVMAPDIEPYVPFIEAVFDLPHNDRKRIPYSIADRTYGRESSLFETFLMLLDLPRGRFSASQILTILEVPIVHEKFDISEDGIELIKHWIRETRIRWGKDEEDRQRLGLPAEMQNTWMAGLQRLLLGYALPGKTEQLFGDILPYDHVEGSQSVVLGNFIDFMQKLFNMAGQLDIQRCLDEWQTLLNTVIETFFVTNNDTASQLQVIRRALTELSDYQVSADFNRKIGLKVIRYHLQAKLRSEGYGYGFLSGGVTFCSMLPMRSIPARVICLLGMDGEAYPRRNLELAFDLIARTPRRGDRSRRNDDRYLFLEALLSARQTFYVSHVGRSIKDNTLIPPSVVISELLDYLDANYEQDGAIGEKEPLSKHLTTIHRLQAFSPDYFADDLADTLFSYSEQDRQAALALLKQSSEEDGFISNLVLPPPDDELREITLEDLYRFYRNPCRFLLNNRLRLYLSEQNEIVEDTESFDLRGLEQYKVTDRLLSWHLSGQDVTQFKKIPLAGGDLPHGMVGECEYETVAQNVSRFVHKTKRAVDLEYRPAFDIALQAGDFRLSGAIQNITSGGLVFYRYARVQAKDYLRAWLQHLIVNSLSDHPPVQTYLLGVESARSGKWCAWKFEPLPDARRRLDSLLAIYWEGLSNPIRFFPNTALTYAEVLASGRTEGSALWNASNTWWGGDLERGEIDDLYFQRCFGREPNPFDDSFKNLARTVYDPMLENREALDA